MPRPPGNVDAAPALSFWDHGAPLFWDHCALPFWENYAPPFWDHCAIPFWERYALDHLLASMPVGSIARLQACKSTRRSAF